jgi:peptide/nickel transport system substrate-binding protein
MFDGLTSTDAYSGEVIPRMAKKIIISPNKKDYTIVLRRGMKWSDGKEITADDVVFTWNDIIFAGFGNTSTRDNLLIDGKLPVVEKIDKYTVKFTTPEPFAPFLRQLATSIAPKHILQPVVNKGKELFSLFGTLRQILRALLQAELSPQGIYSGSEGSFCPQSGLLCAG